MSWMKPGQSGASPGPPAYGAPPPQQHQAFGNQQNVYSNYGAPPPGAAPQQQFWQMQAQQQHQQPQYSQQYGQVYQPEFQTNANQFYQPPAISVAQQTPQYNQNYSTQGYQGNVQQNTPQNYYPNQPHQNFQKKAPNDGWEDNWDWGWEESAKQAQVAQAAPAPHQPPPGAFNNANVIEESFGTNDSWNWPIDDKKDNREPPPAPDNSQEEPVAPIAHSTNNFNAVSEVIEPPVNVNNGPQQNVEEVRTLNDRDVIKERLPNLAAGRRHHLDNLTPQWSIESQMSQESSDGPQTHSEGTYRSENLSRNSSSPGPNTDNSNFNYSQAAFEDNSYSQNNEWSRHSDEHTLADKDTADRESHDDLTNSLQDMSLTNYENVSTSNSHPPERNDSSNTPENISEIQPSPAASPSLPVASGPIATGTGAPAPLAPAPSVRPPSAPSALQPAAASPLPTGPPPTFPPPPSSGSHNPFKNAGPFSHKSTSRTTIGVGGASYLASPAVVAQAQQNRAPVGFEANLETTPDNSERPDQPAAAAFRPPPSPAPAPLPVPDNLEVAPRHDRNEYMQTAHLSTGAGYGEGGEQRPPPGLRRLVVGRREGEEPPPPPGLARHVPGAAQRRVYRQAEGQQAYRPPPPGEPDAYRVVPGLDYPPPRDQDGDGQAAPDRPAPAPDPPPPPPDATPRDLTMEGENLQDPAPADPPPAPAAPAAAAPAPPQDRRPSLPRRESTPDDSDREPRRDRDRARSSRDRDKEGRYSRGDRGFDRDERRSTRDKDRRDRERDRRDRERERAGSPEEQRRQRDRRSARHRYETEDTDYYSDRERERRSYREGSLGKPPRGEGRGEGRRQAAPRREERERYERYERRYRDIDPSRKYGNLRRERTHDPRRRVTFSRGAKTNDSSRSEGVDQSPSREATATDEELVGDVRRDRRRDRERDRDRERERDRRREREREREPYYESVTQRQYEYYEQLRAADPAAYMQLYKQLMATHYSSAAVAGYGHAAPPAGYDDRASLHSGRSSTAGLKANDTYYGAGGAGGAAPSVRTDLSDRDLNTDASLNLQLDESTVRSERMTPFKYSTAHVKGSMASRDLVLVEAAYPVDGAGGAVRVVRPGAACGALRAAPGPLAAPRAHKKPALEYCAARAAAARAHHGTAPDAAGAALLWDLLALLLRQNGALEGSDVADLLMKNVRDFPWKLHNDNTTCRNDSRRESSVSGSADDTPEQETTQHLAYEHNTRTENAMDEAAALEKYEEYLIYGNRQEALEWAMSCGLWGHALALAAHGAARERAGVAARFLAAQPACSVLHTAYAALAGVAPPAVSAAADPRAADWRPHAAVLLANPTRRPDFDTKTLIQLGDALAARGLAYSAQVVWLCAGAGWRAHPLAPHPPRAEPGDGAGAPPARLSLLLADPRAETFAALATPEALLATEMYEYARSLGGRGALPELQVYRLWAALALADGGQYARALAYVEAAARAVHAAPARYPPAFVRALAALADRLKYHEPALAAPPLDADEPDLEPALPWLDHLQALAAAVQVQPQQQTTAVSPPSTPQHQPQLYTPQQQTYSWNDQSQQYQQQQVQAVQQQDVNQTYADPEPVAAPAPPHDYTSYYGSGGGGAAPAPDYPGAEWGAAQDDSAAPVAAPYADYSWQYDQYSYSEGGQAGGEESRPTITMPGAAPRGEGPAARGGGPADDNTDEANSDRSGGESAPSKGSAKGKEDKAGGKEGGKGGSGGWLGGILTKLSLRAPNQMILPDDKNPTIVWDAANKRWVNTEGEGAEGEGAGGALPPPPSNAELAPTLHRQTASPPLQATPGAPPPVSNIFKMQKGRHIKKSYVDVFNPSGAASRPLPPAAEVLGPPGPAPGPPGPANLHYFVPSAQHTQRIPLLSECIEVEVPCTPTPESTPSPDVTPEQSGVYEPTALGDEDQYRTGI